MSDDYVAKRPGEGRKLPGYVTEYYDIPRKKSKPKSKPKPKPSPEPAPEPKSTEEGFQQIFSETMFGQQVIQATSKKTTPEPSPPTETKTSEPKPKSKPKTPTVKVLPNLEKQFIEKKQEIVETQEMIEREPEPEPVVEDKPEGPYEGPQQQTVTLLPRLETRFKVEKTLQKEYETSGIPPEVSKRIDVPSEIETIGGTELYLDIVYRKSIGLPTREQELELRTMMLESPFFMGTQPIYGEEGKTFGELKKDEPALYLQKDEFGYYKPVIQTTRWRQEEFQKNISDPTKFSYELAKIQTSIYLKVFDPYYWGAVLEGRGADYIFEKEYTETKNVMQGDWFKTWYESQIPAYQYVIIPTLGGKLFTAFAGKLGGVAGGLSSKLGPKTVTFLKEFKSMVGPAVIGTIVGADIGKTYAFEHAGLLPKGTGHGKAIGFGMIVGSAYAGAMSNQPKRQFSKYEVIQSQELGKQSLTVKRYFQIGGKQFGLGEVSRTRFISGFEPDIKTYSGISDLHPEGHIFKGDLSKTVIPFKPGVEPIPPEFSLVPHVSGLVPYTPSYNLFFKDIPTTGVVPGDPETFRYININIPKFRPSITETPRLDVTIKKPVPTPDNLGYTFETMKTGDITKQMDNISKKLLGAKKTFPPDIKTHKGPQLDSDEHRITFTPGKKGTLPKLDVVQPIPKEKALVPYTSGLVPYKPSDYIAFQDMVSAGIVPGDPETYRYVGLNIPKYKTVAKPDIGERLDVSMKKRVPAKDEVGYDYKDMKLSEIQTQFSKSSKRLLGRGWTQDIESYENLQKLGPEKETIVDTSKIPKKLRKNIYGPKLEGKYNVIPDYESYEGLRLYTPIPKTTRIVLRDPLGTNIQPISFYQKLQLRMTGLPVYYVFIKQPSIVQPISGFTGFKGKTYSLKDLSKKWEMEKSEPPGETIELGGQELQKLLLEPPVVETETKLVKPKKKTKKDVTTEKVSTKELQKLGRFDLEYYYPPKFFQGQKSDVAVVQTQFIIHEPRTVFDYSLDFMQFQSQGQDFILNQVQDVGQQQKQYIDNIQEQIPIQRQDLTQRTISRVDMTQDQRYDVRQDYKLRTPQKTVTKDPKLGILPLFEIGDVGILGTGDGQAYDVMIKDRYIFGGQKKEREKYFKANKVPLSREDALGLGATAVEHSASRSFYIKPTSGKPKEPSISIMSWAVLGHQFKKKGKIFVETNPYAINTQGEIDEIPARGWIAEKRKREPVRQVRIKQDKVMKKAERRISGGPVDITSIYDKINKEMRKIAF